MTKVIIAISSDISRSRSMSSNDQAIDYAPRDIVRAINQAGAIATVLPAPVAIQESDIDQLVDSFDGLLIPGGPDVDPSFFGEDPIPQLGSTVYERDQFEMSLIKAAVKAGKAIFGICRGIQAINIALGGSVYQDLASQYPHPVIKHRQYPTEGSSPTHRITTKEGSRLAKIVGTTSFVNSRHHQAVKDLGQGLKVTAAASDGVIEGIESIDSDQIVAVQWHPESMWQRFPKQLALFQDFVARTEQRAGH